ncbi:MAG: hypothetical protein C4563_06195 [Desulfobulbus sp.]|jgi:hypothetical protein|nr:MAG: hypothetical protein C4563_06195 [Desulfobulbus sp.]
MMDLKELRQDRKLVNSIDWSMTPEKAVEMYLEWGTGWIRGNDFVSSASDRSVYFVIYDWEKEPCATLILRSVAGAEEIARIPVPAELFEASWKEDGWRPGGTVHPPNLALKEWLCEQIGGPPLDWSVAVH